MDSGINNKNLKRIIKVGIFKAAQKRYNLSLPNQILTLRIYFDLRVV